jgi:hypothetical protein
MNTHRGLGFLAALLITVGQIFVLSAGTVTATNNSAERGEYDIARNA